MLKTLEVSGFKSFAKKTELHFKSPITAIVGPNGSGKSNVAEAFRFVLGEQSMKSMRGKRGEDLIWNGSAEVLRSSRASVKLVFAPTSANSAESRSESVDNIFFKDGFFDEVSIERIVNRDGSNEYFMNGSPVRLKDIVIMLSGAHIGSSGHHIISQGEADRILSANMRERRGIIEDALGLKIFQYKIEESERKLLKTEENIRQVESLRKEIAPHIRFLRKQVEKVEKAKEIRKKLLATYKEYLRDERIYLDVNEKALLSERAPIEEKLRLLESEIETAKIQLQNSSKNDGKSEEVIEIENRLRGERSLRDEFYRQIGKIEGEISANEKLIERLKQDTRSFSTKMVSLTELEDLEREISGYSDVSIVIARLREFIERHKVSNEQNSLEEIISANEVLEKKRIEINGEIESKNMLILKLDHSYGELRVAIEKEKDSSREAEKNIFRLSSEINESKSRLEMQSERASTIEREKAEWKREAEEGAVLMGVEVLRFEDHTSRFGEDEMAFIKEYGAIRNEKRRELEKMKIRLEELGAGGGDDVSREYRETLERDEFLKKELEDLKNSAESLKNLIKDLLERLDGEFKKGLAKINSKFDEFFKLMFDGGSAKLEVVKSERKTFRRAQSTDSDADTDESDMNILDNLSSEQEQGIEEEGVDINVSLPRKRIKGLEMLSGGERALTSIALLFSISQVNPPPFIILDETDAALDEANSKKYGDMIENLSKVSQLILITHNRETMSRAGVIYGVTMGRDGVSRLLSIAFDEAVAVAK
jgi:chromosome segregation protein